MAEPWPSTLTRLTEFFSADHIEASARRTGFVQRASKITGKLFLGLVTFGSWSTTKTSLAQLAAKGAQLPKPLEVSPEAIHQRMTRRALAFLQEMIQTAFAKLHTSDTLCDEGLFAPFTGVYIADSTGFGLPDSLKDVFPGAGGSAPKPEPNCNSSGTIRAAHLPISRSCPGTFPTTNISTRWSG
jgi:hypothetical protein